MRSRIDTAPEAPHLDPLIRIKEGIRRRDLPLEEESLPGRDSILLRNSTVVVRIERESRPDGSRILRLNLENCTSSSIRLTRLFLPLSDGLEGFLAGRDPETIGFLANGHQSWSRSRSFRLSERPFRSWLRIASIISGNLANLPSNRTGDFSSEMFAILADNTRNEGVCIGQLPPLDQFLYIRCVAAHLGPESSHFELIWDFGRSSIPPGASIKLSGVRFSEGPVGELADNYLQQLEGRKNGGREPITGWSSWYYYFNKLTSAGLRANLRRLKELELPLRFFQIDDGYQRRVGDWKDPAPGFEDMPGLAAEIRNAGYRPGIWLAPFIADRGSRLVKKHPEFLLRNEHGRAIPAGYNLNWPGKLFYALDVTNPRVEEFIRATIAMLIRDWGFDYLKLDFLYAACLRGGAHKEISLSRAQVIQRGVEIIRDEAGEETLLSGCGMPITAGVGIFDAMRVGPDTAPSWHKFIGRLLKSESIEGVKNSIRNSFARAGMNRRLWINDPDCVLLRTKETRLDRHERRTQINAAILVGGALFFSDDFSRLGEDEIRDARRSIDLHRACTEGRTLVLDLMEREFPELVYNTAGFLGLFNMGNRPLRRRLLLKNLPAPVAAAAALEEVWSGRRYTAVDGLLVTDEIPPHGSLLLQTIM